MPIIHQYDSKGPYYKFGIHGHKYYYRPDNEKSRMKALAKSKTQGRAIKSSQNSFYR